MSSSSAFVSKQPNSTATQAPASNPGYNPRLYWPDIIKIPKNTWEFSCQQIIDKLTVNQQQSPTEIKNNMEKCLLYFYTLKKKLQLLDHTYTAASILFYRFWYVYGLPASLLNCIHVSQAILVTACKRMENNRPIDAYVRATSEFILQQLPHLKTKYNSDKLKWEIRDKLIENEKRVICYFGFDLDIENPRELIEDIFSTQYRYTRDLDLPAKFIETFPKILQESRNFMIQAVTQPVSLLCDGYTFVALALVYSGLEYKRLIDSEFVYPKNFLSERLPIVVNLDRLQTLFTDYLSLEQNFFDLKSNKGQKLQVSKEELASLLQEEKDGATKETTSARGNPFSYDSLKSGEVSQELLDHIQMRIDEHMERVISESKKRGLDHQQEALVSPVHNNNDNNNQKPTGGRRTSPPTPKRRRW